MELKEMDNNNIYQNSIAILSMSRVDEDSGMTTQFSPPSHHLNPTVGLIFQYFK